MAKQLAISTQLKNALARIVELEKKLKESESSKDNWYKANQLSQNEVEQVHALLDVLPGAAGRKTSHEDNWQQKEINAMTRLASYLAVRQ